MKCPYCNRKFMVTPHAFKEGKKAFFCLYCRYVIDEVKTQDEVAEQIKKQRGEQRTHAQN